MRRYLLIGVLAAIVLGALALAAPVPVAQAGTCVTCSNRDVFCGHCLQFVPQDCQHCAYCKKIPGCK